MLSRTADSLFWLARYVERATMPGRVVQEPMVQTPPCRAAIL